MRFQRAGYFRRATGQQHDHFTFQVQPRQIIVLRFRDRQSVANKDQRCFDTRRMRDAHAEDGFIAKRDGFGLSIADQGKAALVFLHAPRDKFDGLEIAFGSRRFQPRAVEGCRDIFGSLAMFRTARVAPGHFVIREELNMLPPGLGGIGWLRKAGLRYCQENENCQNVRFHRNN